MNQPTAPETSHRDHIAESADNPDALEQALEQSHEVRAKVEACVEDLGATNEDVKAKIAGGDTVLLAQQTLVNTERIEGNVQECADDLHGVTEVLVKGIDDLRQVEIALAASRKSLADTKAALVIARKEGRQARLRALHDSTTGLPNRDLFDFRLAHAVSLADRHSWTLAVMFLDLDRFKSINDTHGHAVGDSVLKEVATRLLDHSRDEDTVCRNGGDEFLYLLMNPRSREDIERIAGALVKNIARPIHIGDLQLVVGASLGSGVYPNDGSGGEQLIRNADAAMYRAKKSAAATAFFTG